MDHHLQQTTSVIQQSAKNISVETFPKASKQPEGLGGQSSRSSSQEAGDSHRPVQVNLEEKEKYTPPHKREEILIIPKVLHNGHPNSRPSLPHHHLYAHTNPFVQPNLYDYDNNMQGGSGGMALGGAKGIQQFPQPYITRNQVLIDLDAVREVVQELYGPSLRQINRPEFHKPYPDAIDHDNPYPRGYMIPEFSLFSSEEGQSTLEHVAKFTIQYGELANYENFCNFKLRLFPNLLIGSTFTWYATLPRNSVFTWQEMKRAFHT